MRYSTSAVVTAGLVGKSVSGASLSDICSVTAVQSALPSNGTLSGIDLPPSTVTAANATSGSTTYCNITVSYVHTNTSNTVSLVYAFPDPSAFKNRFYVGGGGGYTLNSAAGGGLDYGAVSGATDAGYGFDTGLDTVALYGNGSLNWDNIYMFAYQGLGEMTQIGKTLATNLYGLSSTKIYTYYEGCSDGGREGWSQVQKYGDEYDGVIVGAPAFRMSHQQVVSYLSLRS
jgi:tannase